MNQTNHSKPYLRVAFIEAKWHHDIVGQCRKGFLAEFARQGYDTGGVETFAVPGSLEIPLMAKKLAELGDYDAVVAAGLIVDGGIYRHDFVARTVLDGLMRVGLDSGLPVLSAVLTPHNFQETAPQEAFFRDHFVLKGKEAADACIEIVKAHRGLTRLETAAA